jgi:hypothetical protein
MSATPQIKQNPSASGVRRSAAVTGVRSGLAAVAASYRPQDDIETTQEMPLDSFDDELAPLPPVRVQPAPHINRVLAAAERAAAASAPAEKLVAHRSLSPVKTAPVLTLQGFGALPRLHAPVTTPSGSPVKREVVVAFSSFACVGAVAALLAAGFPTFGTRTVSAKEATRPAAITAPAPQIIVTTQNETDTASSSINVLPTTVKQNSTH